MQPYMCGHLGLTMLVLSNQMQLLFSKDKLPLHAVPFLSLGGYLH